MSNINSKLFYHQLKALEGCSAFPFRLIYRLPGTGKTRIGVELVKKQLCAKNGSMILWLGPANLIMQYQKVFKEFNIEYNIFKPDYADMSSGICVVASYEMMRLHFVKFINKRWDCVICDEFHRAKNHATQTNSVLKKLRKKAASFFAFTGTPFQNSPYEFFELINLVAAKNLSFECESTLQYKRPKRSFIRNFLGEMGFTVKRINQGPVIGIAEPERLYELIFRYIDYMQPEKYIKECRLPVISERIEYITLAEPEISSYLKILKTYRKVRERQFFNDELDDERLEKTFNNLIALRQNLLSMNGKISSKILSCVRDLQTVLNDKANRVLVFSNFVEHGLKQLAKVLDKESIKFNLYDGDTTIRQRRTILDEFFSGETPLMLLSPVGFEGLDLYGTTHIFVLDPHFNPERTRQLISRAVRAYSGVSEIKVCHYIAVINDKKRQCIDEAILRIANRKRNLAEMLESCLALNN